jgi:hypothetical protein
MWYYPFAQTPLMIPFDTGIGPFLEAALDLKDDAAVKAFLTGAANPHWVLGADGMEVRGAAPAGPSHSVASYLASRYHPIQPHQVHGAKP